MRNGNNLGNSIMKSLIGWGLSTLFLLLLRRNDDSNVGGSQKASKNTYDNINQIGSPIPVVLGRGIIKNPLVSYYGDFSHEIYTEEYGAWTDFDWASLIPSVMLSILAFCSQESPVVGTVNAGIPVQAGPYGGQTTGFGTLSSTTRTTDSGIKNARIIMTIVSLLLQLLTALLANHFLRTTIQKGFKYYLGWQHIICWTNKEIGIKKLWMNVYDSKVEESTEQGVWDNNNKIAWLKDNPTGITAHIDEPDMFGGYDDGGGFIGDVRFYLGGYEQPMDSWMQNQMDVETIDADLRRLTPKYPMFVTCVIPKAYIGKQATIPEMWFEIVNYPNRLYNEFKYDLYGLYDDYLEKYLNKIFAYIQKQDNTVIEYLHDYIEAVTESRNEFSVYKDAVSLKLRAVDSARERYESMKRDSSKTEDEKNSAKEAFDKALAEFNEAQENLTNTFAELNRTVSDLLNNYPSSKRDEFSVYAEPLLTLLNNGIWSLGKLGDDLNPAEAIFEILCNEYWGCDCEDISKIDIVSLMRLGITCEEEKLGISCVINNSTQAKEYIDKILSHINGVKYDDPTTGKLTFKLIRNDYEEKNLVEFNPSNSSSMEFSRLDWSETSSSVSVNFTDASDKYNESQLVYHDISNRLITGVYTEKQIDGEYFTTPENALVMAQTQLLSAGYPLSAINFKCNRLAHNLTIGDAIIINWEPYGIKKQIFRITDIDYATLTSGEMSITAVEDVFGFSKTEYEYSETQKWNDVEFLPEDVTTFLYLEYPYEITRSLNTYVKAFAKRPTQNCIYWNIWRYKSGNYEKTATSQLWSLMAYVVYGYDMKFSFDENYLELHVGNDGRNMIEEKLEKINSDEYSYTHKSGLNLVMIGNELLSYDKIERTQNGNYLLKGIVRGVYDTLPEKHVANDIAYFIEGALDINNNYPCAMEGSNSHEQLEITVDTISKKQEFDIQKLYNLHTERRSEQPTVMANLKFGADKGELTEYKYSYPAGTQFSYDIKFDFIGRNKFYNGGVLYQDDAETYIEVSEDVQNVIGVTSNDKEFEFKFDARNADEAVNITNMTLSWSDFCFYMSDRLKQSNDVILHLKTYDKVKELYSWAEYTREMVYIAPKLVGIVETENDAQIYADSICEPTLVTIPAGEGHSAITMTYEDAPLIFIGENKGQVNYNILGHDGNYWTIGTDAYRIDGYDTETNSAIIHKINIDIGFVFTHIINSNMEVRPEAYKYTVSNGWTEFIYYK